jgi:hypothetical protein
MNRPLCLKWSCNLDFFFFKKKRISVIQVRCGVVTEKLSIKRVIVIPWLLLALFNQSKPSSFFNLRFLLHFLFTNPKYHHHSLSANVFNKPISHVNRLFCFPVSRQQQQPFTPFFYNFCFISRFGPRILCLLPNRLLFLWIRASQEERTEDFSLLAT